MRRAPRAGALWRLPPGPLVLASTSPRRRALLAEQGLRFTAMDPGVDEDGARGAPRAVAATLALAKARAAARRRPRAWCLGADTVVALGRRCLGKPRDAADSRRMLRALSGRAHRVFTAVALVGPGHEACRTVMTEVRFRRLAPWEVEAYAASGEPYDKAGGYGAQGQGAVLVSEIRGDWSNVVGLPLGATRELLARAAAAAIQRHT